MRHRRYQNGCLFKEKRKGGPDVWAFRYRDGQANRKEIIGTVEQFKTKGAAQKACELIRVNINRGNFRPRTIADLVAHYTEKELSENSNKAHSTRHVYGSYIKSWILPEWGTHSLSDVRTVDVEARSVACATGRAVSHSSSACVVYRTSSLGTACAQVGRHQL